MSMWRGLDRPGSVRPPRGRCGLRGHWRWRPRRLGGRRLRPARRPRLRPGRSRCRPRGSDPRTPGGWRSPQGRGAAGPPPGVGRRRGQRVPRRASRQPGRVAGMADCGALRRLIRTTPRGRPVRRSARRAVDTRPSPTVSRPRASSSPRASAPRSASSIDGWAAGLSGTIDAGLRRRHRLRPAGRRALRPDPRRDGTLRAYSGQRAHADPFVAVGRQDLTAHVDFTAVDRALATNGWRTLGSRPRPSS